MKELDGTLVRRSSILLGERQTSIFSRIVARGIDVLVLVAIYFIAQALSKALGVVIAFLYCAFQDGLWDGQSVGKRIIGLRVIDDTTRAACPFRQSFLRNFPCALTVLFLAIPWLWAFLVLVSLPVLATELYFLILLDSGARLGDVLGNTLVVESLDESFEIPQG